MCTSHDNVIKILLEGIKSEFTLLLKFINKKCKKKII